MHTRIITHPIPLEALLGAEIAVSHPKLEASRTLKGPRVIVAITPHALADSDGLRPHGNRKIKGFKRT